jgi:DNA-binding NarL/FixJ family response regulator
MTASAHGDYLIVECADMETQLTIALIVIRPGPLRNSLQTLMSSMQQIQIVAESRDVSALLQLGAQRPPDLVVMEAALPGGEVCSAVSEMKARWSRTRTIVLVENAAQQREAEAAGADAVLYHGFRAARLTELVEELLSD